MKKYLLILLLLAPCVIAQPVVMQSASSYMKNRMGFYNVKDFGAKGDSVTNDRVAIQAAIDSASASTAMGTVWFPPDGGIYRIEDSMLQIRKGSKNVRLVGNGARIITDATTALWGGGVMTANGDSANICENIEITGFVFEDHLQDSSYHNATGVAWTNGAWVHHNRIKRASRKGMSSHWGNNVFFHHNIIDSVGYAGIVIEHAFGIDSLGDTIWTNRNISVCDNIIRWIDTLMTDSIEDGSWTSGKGVGICITNQGSANPHIRDVIVKDNIILSHQNRFIHLAYVDNALVDGNLLDTCQQTTFDIAGAGSLRLYSTDSTEHNNSVSVVFRHYDWAEEDILALWGWSDNSDNSRLDVGGGSGDYNAIEELRIFTGIGDVATTGVERLSIDSGGVFFRGPGNVYYGDAGHTNRYFYSYYYDNGGYGHWMRYDATDEDFEFSDKTILPNHFDTAAVVDTIQGVVETFTAGEGYATKDDVGDSLTNYSDTSAVVDTIQGLLAAYFDSSQVVDTAQGLLAAYPDTSEVVDTAQALDNIVRSEFRDTVMAVIDTLTMEIPIWNPDLITDTLPVFYADSTEYPYGIKIISASIQTSVDGAYSLKLFSYTAADPPVLHDYVDTLVVGASDQRFSSETFEDADASTIDKGQILYLLTPATDIDWIRVQIRFYRKAS